MREAKIKVLNEDTDWNYVRLAQVVDESADVTIETGIYAVDIPFLKANKKLLSKNEMSKTVRL